jgi:plasmid stabilization system protein ParE
VTYKVRLTREAEDDLVRLFDFIIERELAREGGDLELADKALGAIRDGLALLERFPFTCRKAGVSPHATPFARELVIPFGHTGYVALFEVVDDQTVIVGAVRHQREDDFH